MYYVNEKEAILSVHRYLKDNPNIIIITIMVIIIIVIILLKIAVV